MQKNVSAILNFIKLRSGYEQLEFFDNSNFLRFGFIQIPVNIIDMNNLLQT